MNNNRFINIHSHIFTVNHAPDFFLQTVIPNRSTAKFVQQLLQKKGTRWVIKWIRHLFWGHKRNVIEKYLGFLEIGLSATQEDVFNKIRSAYTQFGEFGIVTLGQDLDNLDLEVTTSPHKRVQTQVQEVLELKRNALYQRNIYPFLPVDPRTALTLRKKEWWETNIHADKGFCGIKIYPAAGFFPFDERLEAMWEWAAFNNIPVMTHTTRMGSYYLGSQESIINTGGFFVRSFNEGSPAMIHIKNRINATLAENGIKKKNGIWCNVFGNPQCYEPVLERFNNLKICFAHIGGSNEVIRSQDNKPLPNYPAQLLDNNWYVEILKLMKKYPNVYTDISYTLSDNKAMEIIAGEFLSPGCIDDNGRPLLDRLMFGTDFFMTQREKLGTEPLLQKQFVTFFKNQAVANRIAYVNTAEFLKNNIYDVFA